MDQQDSKMFLKPESDMDNLQQILLKSGKSGSEAYEDSSVVMYKEDQEPQKKPLSEKKQNINQEPNTKE